MMVRAKICGIKDELALEAAVINGAAFVGLNFYDASPRFVDIQNGARLAAMVPREFTQVVALTVNADDVYLDTIVDHVAPDFIQLHGHETVERVAEIRRAFGLPVIKAIPIADTEDIEIAREFDEVSDWLLFDAKPTTSSEANLPGGNGIAFDWRLLQGQSWTHPWMLSGGLVASTVCEAARLTGAQFVDVASGVESVRGQKDPGLIKEFLQCVAHCGEPAAET